MRSKFYMVIAVVILSFVSPAVLANDKKAVKDELTTEQQVRLNQIIRRVDEIRAMDKSALSRLERKELKSELLQLKKEAKVMKGGIYLSVGAIIIIILVLILIL